MVKAIKEKLGKWLKEYGLVGTTIVLFLTIAGAVVTIVQLPVPSIPDSLSRVFWIVLTLLLILTTILFVSNVGERKRREALEKDKEIYSEVVQKLPEQMNEALTEIRAGLAMKKTGPVQMLEVALNHETGRLLFGDIRNVLLRVDTVLCMLDEFFDTSEDVSAAKSRLFRLGHSIGQDFARDYVKARFRQWGTEEYSINELIAGWCDYDVEAGLGRFSETTIVSQPLKGAIYVNNSFLVEPADSDIKCHLDLCSFMEGYIAGVLGHFLQIVRQSKKACQVIVSETRCGRGCATPCVFEFAEVETTASTQ